jgi:hypothetical protein
MTGALRNLNRYVRHGFIEALSSRCVKMLVVVTLIRNIYCDQAELALLNRNLRALIKIIKFLVIFVYDNFTGK